MKEKIRAEICAKIGRRLRFKYNGARNQNEEFFGFIENTYSNVFTIKTENSNTAIKTFSYGDVLTNASNI